MKLLNSFLVCLFICNFDCYATTAAAGGETPKKQIQQRDDLQPPATATHSVAQPFATPQRQIIANASVISPPRADKRPWGASSVLLARLTFGSI